MKFDLNKFEKLVRPMTEKERKHIEDMHRRASEYCSPKKYLLNAFSLQMIEDIAPCDISIREVFNPDLSELKSCVGHIDTSNMLGVDYNRQNVSLKKGDFAIVAQVVGGRLPEGCTKLPEGVKFKFYQIEITGDKFDRDFIEQLND